MPKIFEPLPHYKTLGVAKECDTEGIKTAYRKLAMRFHPDRNPGNKKAEQKFKDVNEAYDVLKDDEKRAVYDRYGQPAFPQKITPAKPYDFSVIAKWDWQRKAALASAPLLASGGIGIALTSYGVVTQGIVAAFIGAASAAVLRAGDLGRYATITFAAIGGLTFWAINSNGIAGGESPKPMATLIVQKQISSPQHNAQPTTANTPQSANVPQPKCEKNWSDNSDTLFSTLKDSRNLRRTYICNVYEANREQPVTRPNNDENRKLACKIEWIEKNFNDDWQTCQKAAPHSFPKPAAG